MKKNLLSILLLLFGMAAMAQLQNTSFEQWENPVDDPILPNRPTGWIRSNGVPGSEMIAFYHDPATDAQNGEYALRLSIWYTYDKDMAYQVAPIATRPAALTGYYKYTQNVIDNPINEDESADVASASVYLTKWNEALQRRDTIGTGEVLLSGSNNYSFFSCPIVYTTNEVPDTIKVILDCSLMRKGEESNGITTTNIGGVGSIFTVDNIALTDNLSTNSLNAGSISIYPNPTKNTLFVTGFEGDASIYDVLGKLVIKTRFSEGTGINTESLQPGVYMLTLKNDTGVHQSKFVKQ